MTLLSLRNRQKTRIVNLRLLRKVTLFLLRERAKESQYELGIHLVGETEMATLNQSFLQHEGSTDIITFDYRENGTGHLHGELFICIDDAVSQSREFKTTWQAELARYVAHGILHLQGFDDLQSGPRKKMKRIENDWVERLNRAFSLKELEASR